MAGHCKVYPEAENGNDSKLFIDLKNNLGDRELAKKVWGFTKTDLFKSEFTDLVKDENGEPTYEEVDRILGLSKLLNSAKKDIGNAIKLGIVDSYQRPVVYTDARVAMNKASEFNQNASSKIAIVEKNDDGKYETRLEDNTALAIAQADRNESRRRLNSALIALIQRAGFDVEFTDDPTFYGVFDPMLAENNAENLRKAIRVSKNELGLNRLPEEVSHLIIAGLKNNQLKERLDKICTDAVVREVLGDEYEEYREKYRDSKMPIEERLREEAEGKILADFLFGNETSKPNRKQTLNISKNEYTDEFRQLQRKSEKLSEAAVRRYHNDPNAELSDQDRRRIGGIYERLLDSGKYGAGNDVWINLKSKKYDTKFRFAQVNPTLFHDVFAINRQYLRNGELVDLHDDYAGDQCFLSDDGLCGFAIEPDGNLISVFSINPSDKKGFLYAIADFAKSRGATHLDAFASPYQNLEDIYQKTLGFQTASRMKYNMEYDHDDIAKNHNNPDVVFMVNSNSPISEKSFDENSYDEAATHQMASISRPASINSSSALMNRIWDKAKSMFAGMSETDIDNAIIDANNALQDITSLIESGEIDTILDKEQIKKHEKMYALAAQVEKLADIAQEGETILSKKLYILQNTQTKQDTKALRKKIDETRKAIENQRYSQACYGTLRTICNDIKDLMKEADKMGSFYNNTTDLNLISMEAGLVNRMSIATQAYEKYLQTLSSLHVLIKRGQIEMDNEYADAIVNLAKESLDQLKVLSDDIRELRFQVLKQLVSMYYGDNGNKPADFKETDKIKWESVNTILHTASRDINWMDTNLFSAGDSKNPLINVIHHIVVAQQAKRNNKINKLVAKMQEAHKKLTDAGYSDDFVYQKDINGLATGFYVAPVDEARFRRERMEFIDSLDAENMDYYEIQRAIEKWDKQHTETVEVGKPITPDGKRRTEIHPKRELYPVDNFQRGWSQEQKDYYNALLEMKAEMDSVLPVSMQNIFMAPQVRRSVSQMFDKNGRGALGTVWNKWKQSFSVVQDNTDYANDIIVTGKDGKKRVLLDFAGKPIKRVPIYYTTLMDDMRDLSTDATHAMVNYITMSVNYSEMGQLAEAMRLMQDHVREEYQVVQTDGGHPLVDMFRSLGREYERTYVKTGSETKVVRAITEYIDRMFFNDTKEKLGNIQISEDKVVSKDAMFNIFMRLTSVSRMGFNVLSGITNATQGESQMIAEAIANRYFNIKDLGFAKKEYALLLKDYMADFNSADRHDKMYMLINQFNSSEDYFRDMNDKDFNKSAFKRVLGRGNIYFLNTMGEHYLHTSGMLAVLNHEKVKRVGSNNEVSLYDVIKQVHDKDGWHLELDSDIEFVNKDRPFLRNFNDKSVIKKSDRDKLFNNLSIYINKLNAGMHGGYSEAEKGNANRQALWRAILQFRQWMFGMYNKMYTREHYDSITGKIEEGGYNTIFRFITGTIQDMKNMSLKLAIENNNLSDEERQNVRVAMAQTSLFVFLTIVCAMTKGWKDKDDRNLRLLAYQMRRLEMETGALVPYPPTFIKNVFTLIQSPAAGIKTLENAMQVFDMASLFQEVQSGRFKGWWKPAKAIWVSTPLYNIQRLIDMDDYNYMFNIFS
jgi:hypothetical protein